jgi:signal transduction histidine kinase/ActR/RegA family two-component response regulator
MNEVIARRKGFEPRLRRALSIVTSLSLFAAVVGWIGLSVIETNLERHQAQSLADLRQITSLVSKSVLLAAEASNVGKFRTLAALRAGKATFRDEMQSFATLARQLPRPPSTGVFDVSEVPSIVRLVNRLDATTQSLFSITDDRLGIQDSLAARRRALDSLTTGGLEVTMSFSTALRAISTAMLEDDLRAVDRLESEFSSYMSSGSPTAASLIEFTDVFALRRKEIGAQNRSNATEAMVEVAFGQLTEMIESLSGLVERAALDRGNQMVDLMRTAKAGLIVSALLCLAGGLMLSAFLTRAMVRSLVGATEAIRRLAEGDASAELPGRDRVDEIGELARAFTVFKANAIERSQLIQQVRRDAQVRLGILNGLDEGVALFDVDGNLTAWNTRFVALSGLPVGDVQLGMALDRLLDVLRTKSISRGSVALEAADQQGQPQSGQEFQFESGRTVEFRVGGMPRGETLVTLVDLTDRKDMEKRLLQGRQMEALGQLTGGIAHDFNNLLAAVSSNLQLIQDQAKTSSPTHTRATRALGAVESGTAMIQRLLAFARQQPLDPEIVDLNELIAGLVDLIELSLDPAITLTTELDTKPVRVVVDPGQMESAILNLVFNARDAIQGRGTIRLRTAILETNAIELAVIDNGLGMSPEVVARALDPFFTTKAFGAGSGLGLSTVFGFIRQSGGYLAVDSTPGIGTTVRITLPASVEGELKKPRRAGQLPSSKPPAAAGRVLVVEDDENLRATTVDMVCSLGFTASSAASAEEAMVRLNQESFDILFSDIVLQDDENGVVLAERARELDDDLAVLLCTGYAAGDGATDVTSKFPILKKPYTRLELSRMLRAALEQHSQPSKNASTLAENV